MLVEVVELRRDGAKLPRAEVLAARPRVADLEVHRVGSEIRATLMPPGPNNPGHGYFPPYLKDCRLIALRGTSFVLVGLERVGRWGAEKDLPQAWWCRIPGDAGRQPARPSEGWPLAEATATT